MTQKQSFFLLVLVTFLLFSCKKESYKVWLDNPTAENLDIKVNGNSYPLSSKEGVEIDLGKGNHKVEVKGDKFEVEVNSDGLLNAAGEEYVLWNDIYYDKNKMDKAPDGALKEDSISIDGKKYYGELVLFGKSSRFISKTWDFDVKTAFPETVDLVKQEYITYKKLFRKSDFIEEYNMMYSVDEKELNRLVDSIMKTRELGDEHSHEGAAGESHEGHTH